MVLPANLQSEMVLTIFTIFGNNYIQKLIILKVIIIEKKMFAVLKQAGNYLFQTWYVKRLHPL